LTVLRPIPDLDNAQAMTKLGRLSAIRSARMDATNELRDVVTRLQGTSADVRAEIEAARVALTRLEELERLAEIVSA
jgi:hypothetical protein